ncbi:MAG TPA: pyridoxal-dependent decarboxylase, partial [Anaerolineales bacterium]|nr:pyridoxal-dependent decarboxylase [Anaerolineales bacterium]
MNTDEFRRVGHRLIDWIADYREGIASLPVRSQLEPGAVRNQLPPSPPAAPESFDHIFSDLEHIIVPGLSHWQHPDFYGYFPSNGELASVLGDYLS